SIEAATAGGGDRLDGPHIIPVVREGELVDGGVPSLEMLHSVEEVGLVAQRARNGAQATDVLGVTPAGIVPAAIAVGNERGARRALRTALLRR
ncbi:MAG: hypothetical protein M3Z17_03995, partial [Gemmatimonadota bacterium]|nr:hypothetical protein [Gemmatimonadota bacterium]